MNNKGFSLIEILVVLVVFGVLTVLVTQSVFLTIKGTNKSENTIKVRENIDYAVAVMERQLRNADSVNLDTCGTSVTFEDSKGDSSNFELVNDRIKQDTNYLTSEEVLVTDLSFDCTSLPIPRITITIKASSASGGVESGSINIETQITRRDY